MKRSLLTIGSILCIEIEGQYKRFFQYIARDVYMFGAPVIRVFKTCYSMDYEPFVEDILKDDIDFYAHCLIKIWEQSGLWYKVGNSKNIGDISNIDFVMSNDLKIKPRRWWTWKIGQSEPIYLGYVRHNQLINFEYGSLLPASEIIYRIKHGRYQGIYHDEWVG